MEYNVNGLSDQSNGSYDMKQTKDLDTSGLAKKVEGTSISVLASGTPPSPVSWPYPPGTGNTPPTGDPDGD